MGKQVSLDTELVRSGRDVSATPGPLNEAVTAKVRPRLSEAAYLEKLVRLRKNGFGDEVPDPTVMEPPIGWVEAPTMVELMRKMIRDHDIEKGLMNDEYESFDEADDFDVGDENAEELRSGWENDFEPAEVEKIKGELQRKEAERRASGTGRSDEPELVEKVHKSVSTGKRSEKQKKSLDADNVEE